MGCLVGWATTVVGGAVALLLIGSALDEGDQGGPKAPKSGAQEQAAPPEAVASPAALPAASRPTSPTDPRPAAAPALLQDAGDGDGDSWHDTAGNEYRLGLVNTPERDECFGSEATSERKRLTASGFRARQYATDDYGRAVSVVTTPAGVNVNVHLARRGFADDRYLERFRRENPALAVELDEAFSAAKAEAAGLWSSCRGGAATDGVAPPPPAAAPAPAQRPARAGSCHPDYNTCIAVRGDGSGRGAANDLDCGEIGRRVQLRQAGVDPYRLDRDGDGIGCD